MEQVRSVTANLMQSLPAESYSATTLAVDTAAVSTARAMIQGMRNELLTFLSQGAKRDDVYHLEIAFVPVTRLQCKEYDRHRLRGGIPGGIWPAPPEAASFVQLFIEVDDVKRYVRDAAALVHKVIIPPQKLPEGDELAILHDPEGIPFGIRSVAIA